MIPLIVYVLAFVLLICCWWVGDMEGRTKLIITGIYALSWGLCFLDPWAVVAAQALFALVVGSMTFGPSWGR